MKTSKFLSRLFGDGRGATSVEYAMVLGMIFLAIIGAISALGDQDSSMFNHVSSTSVNAMRSAV